MPDWKQHSPRAEHLWGTLSEEELSCIDIVDRRDVPHGETTERPEDSPFSLRRRMGSHERMAARMATGWPPFGYYLIVEYVDDLYSRESLGSLLDQLHPALGRRIRELLQDLDCEIWDHTVDDVDGLLIDHAHTSEGSTLLSWWWHRVPSPAPWPNP